MADDLESFRVAIGDDADRRVALDHERGIDQLAVDTPGERGTCET